MRVLLKLILDCEPDAAWRAIRSPAVLREVSSPLFTLTARDPDGFPTIWEPGSYPVRVRGAGILPIGSHDIRISFDDHRTDGVRIMRDSGGFPGTTSWDHRLAVSPDPAGPDAEGRVRTLYRDRLLVSAGPVTPALWYGLWAFWQWRGARMRALAPGWAYDPPLPEDAAPDGAGDDGARPLDDVGVA
jgi:hypothetical protein